MKATSEEPAVFVPVVESGSLSRAAEQLGQTNPTINQAAKKLETKLGVSLLNRTTRQPSLAEGGERYFRHVQSILQEMAVTESEIMETCDTPRGLLWIDAATPVVPHFLMPSIKPFRGCYPEVTLSLVPSETTISSIERKVNVTVRAGTLTSSSLCTRPLFNSYRKVIASPDYIFYYREPEMIDNLEQHICPGLTESVPLNTWPIACSDRQLHEVKYGLSSNSGETLKQLYLSGNGTVCLSDYMIDREIARGELMELMADKVLPVEMPFSAVYYNGRTVSTRIQVFIDFLSEHVGTAPGGAVGEA